MEWWTLRDGAGADPRDLGPAVRDQLDAVADKLSAGFPVVAAMLREAREDVTAFAAFPFAHWKKIWSTNPLERGQ